jgi:hypothetical protein
MYTLVSAALSSLKTRLEVLFCYDCDTCCHTVLNFFYGCELMACEAYLDPWDKPEIAKNETAKEWLKFGFSSKTVPLQGNSGKMYCHGAEPSSRLL